MATFVTRKNGGRVRHQAKIRLKGHPQVSETFDRLTDAKAWAADTEYKLKYGFLNSVKTSSSPTVADAIERYLDELVSSNPSRYKAVKPMLVIWSARIGTNPFLRVKVISLFVKHPPVEKGYWSAFQDSCRLWGITKALARQPKVIAAKLKKCLLSASVDWWQMSEIEWKAALKSALQETLMHLVPSKKIPLTAAILLGKAA